MILELNLRKLAKINTHLMTAARALRRRRGARGPVTLETCSCVDGLTAPRIFRIV